MGRKKYHGNCPYCGQYDKLTKDHVIPQCLFPEGKPLPGNLPKIRACADCNGTKKSKYDTLLRDLLATDMNSSKSPIAQELFAPFSRAAISHQSILVKDILENNQPIALATASGIIYDFAYTVPKAQEYMDKALSEIVKGLYYYYLRKPLSEHVAFDVMRLRSSESIDKVLHILGERGGLYTRVGDGDVFQCAFAEEPNMPYATVWLLNFYKSVMFMVITGPRTGNGSVEKQAG